MFARRRHRRSARRPGQPRRGVEIVELAFALPVMTVIVFGTLEVCEVMFLRQSLALASYEVARIAARPGGTTATAQTRFDQLMVARRVTGATMTMTPADPTTLSVGDRLRVDVTAPVAGNNSTNLVLNGLPDVVESVVVVRE